MSVGWHSIGLHRYERLGGGSNSADIPGCFSGAPAAGPVLVVVTTTLRLRIASEQDLPDEDELAGETIEEVRLALEA